MLLLSACSFAIAAIGVDSAQENEKSEVANTTRSEWDVYLNPILSVPVIKEEVIEASIDPKYSRSCAESVHLNERVTELEIKIQDVYTETALGCATAQTAPARPSVDGYGLFFSADALYWKIFEGGAEYLVTNVSQFGSTNENETPLQSGMRKANFDWKWGYRIGAAYYLPHDDWDIELQFTRYETQAHDAFQSENTLGVLIGPAITGIFAFGSEIDWHIKYSTLDFTIGRSFFLNPLFAIRPHIGIRGAWIHQNIHAFFDQISDLIPVELQLQVPIDTKNHFSGVGPVAGVDTQWFFDKHWSFFSQFSAELLYGKFEVDYDLSFRGIPIFEIDADTNRIVPAVQTILGLGWQTDFQDHCYHLAIQFGYELQIWWRQNQQPSFDTLVNWVRYSEDLSLHGATIDVRIDF